MRTTLAIAAALPAALAEHPGVRASSGVVVGGTGTYAAVAFMEANGLLPMLTIYPFDGTFVPVTTLPLERHSEVLSVSTVTAHRLTGSADPDLAVTVYDASAALTSIVSDVGGAWHLLTFIGGGPSADARTEVQGVTFRDRDVVSTYPDCHPNCADGGELTDYFTYACAEGDLEPDPAFITDPEVSRTT